MVRVSVGESSLAWADTDKESIRTKAAHKPAKDLKCIRFKIRPLSCSIAAAAGRQNSLIIRRMDLFFFFRILWLWPLCPLSPYKRASSFQIF